MGLTTAILAASTALILQATTEGKLSSLKIYRFSLLLTVLAIIITSHLGASLTHGEDYLSIALPGNNHIYDDSKATSMLAQLKPIDSLNIDQLDELNLEVRAIIAHNCYQCHNANKQKGELVLDSKRGLFLGGESGLAVVKDNQIRVSYTGGSRCQRIIKR